MAICALPNTENSIYGEFDDMKRLSTSPDRAQDDFDRGAPLFR